MKYKVIEILAYRNVVEVEAKNKEEARNKAFEGGEMSANGKYEDIVIQDTYVEEIKNETI